ncbi:MAG: hypothetical protein LBS81_02175 [Endomicrobium sp.]|jgi:lipoate-protein ligase A|nr:hypothetical protein [Endomicrobium sp.]
MLRWINDIPRNAVMNMSLDEFLFNEYKNEPVLRTYCWDNAYTTIGYFQKSGCGHSFIRRLTGGLTVQHHYDISYSFIISSDFWNVYSQRQTYRNIHLLIQKTLQNININSVILDKNAGNATNVCVQSFYENDLLSEGKKIVGSCLRRRANKIIAQGSIHARLNDNNKTIFSRNFAVNTAEFLKTDIKTLGFSNSEIESAEKIAKEKYSNPKWNDKF